ncbi:hypothetical protein KPL76_07565 [Subtercola sp. PAMC28395]|uniref:hypothetical protein n=1 Tax=Subtercola sp. PAMC28395 TaxID=2846775 RepID=UPI001C0E78B8|nr:hypothetical protein [Subtercola sp. PAMC28395]QWT22674.1 hypothetical protein KPL76_07565 [Subtercola sp. PAMC28395]
MRWWFRRNARRSDIEVAEYCATIILYQAISKLDTLAVISLVVDAPVENAKLGRPVIRLADQAWVEVELPKLGEPPPLAIDVYSTVSTDQARLEALTLVAALRRQTAWDVRPDFGESDD